MPAWGTGGLPEWKLVSFPVPSKGITAPPLLLQRGHHTSPHGAELPDPLWDLESKPHHFLAWTGASTPLPLGLFLCKMGVIADPPYSAFVVDKLAAENS